MVSESCVETALTYFANAAELAAIIDGAPDLLNTLNELAAAVGDDPTFFTSVASNLTAHSTDTTSVHGISNTALLATSAEVATAKGQAISDAAAAADTKISTHTADTTDVHGIVNTALLETISGAQAKVDTAIAAEVTNRDTAISTHNSDQTMVHGITDTAQLALKSETAAVQSALTSEITNRDTAISEHNSDTTNVHGIANTASIAMIADITAHSNDTTVHSVVEGPPASKPTPNGLLNDPPS